MRQKQVLLHLKSAFISIIKDHLSSDSISLSPQVQYVTTTNLLHTLML